jgi:hypothetical protein
MHDCKSHPHRLPLEARQIRGVVQEKKEKKLERMEITVSDVLLK